MVFLTAEELASQIKLVLKEFNSEKGSEALRVMRENLKQFASKENSWDN